VGGTNGIPVIDNRQYQGRLVEGRRVGRDCRIGDRQRFRNAHGHRGLMNIPWINHLFSHHTHVKESTQTLILLKPHFVALPPCETALKPIWTGTESRPITPF
jgi:hypothetical protein